MSNPPWWLSAIVGLVGVVVGIVVKWLLDLRTEAARRRREDNLRFVGERQALYVELFAILENIANARILLAANGMRLRREPAVRLDEGRSDEINRVVQAQKERIAEGFASAQKALRHIQVLAPGALVEAADRCIRALVNGSRPEFERAEHDLLREIQRDLRVPLIGASPHISDPADHRLLNSWTDDPELSWLPAPTNAFNLVLSDQPITILHRNIGWLDEWKRVTGRPGTTAADPGAGPAGVTGGGGGI